MTRRPPQTPLPRSPRGTPLSVALLALVICGPSCTRTEVLLSGRDGSAGCDGASCPCPAGWTDCGGTCVDPDSDPNHCGGCDRPCGALEECVSGQCACTGGAVQCGETCREVSRDPNACGDCQTRCEVGEQCVSGQCTCLPDLTRCGEQCVDTRYDADHCGACDHRCSEDPAGPYCSGGQCSAVPCSALSPSAEGCSPGDTSCVPSASLASHPLHCGDCGETCDADEVCVQGVCQGWFLPAGCTACPCGACGANRCCFLPGTSDPICVVGVSSCPVQP